ncbi:hypothetical protein DMA11_22715 [Marinilabiliaceae bacterium JC017]|nr:hypothetical protein DMA11_22715 [Marinilabiliaceae bacterium JC017]
MQTLNKLPLEKITEVYDFAEYLLSKIDDTIISQGIQELTSSTSTYDFLKDEEDLYSENDLQEKIQMKKGDIVLIHNKLPLI